MSAERPVIASLVNASKRYANVVALQGVDLRIYPGELLALLGPNGAGKTTAISLLLGLLRADSGTATLFGLDPRTLAARRCVGAMLQAAGVPETLRVAELMRLFQSYYPRPFTVADVVSLAGVQSLLDKRYANLSGGQQRQVQFALAIIGQPELLFLDEPTTGLDIRAREAVWNTIRVLVREGCAVVLTTHYLEEAEALADRVSVLARGQVVAEGSVQEIRARVVQRHIRCLCRLDPETISAWPRVRSVSRDGERVEIVTDNAERVVRRLLQSDPDLAELEVRRAGLAEAFAEITREAA